MLITCRGPLGLADSLAEALEAAGVTFTYIRTGDVHDSRRGRLTQHLRATGPGESLDLAIASVGIRRPDLRVSVTETRGASFVTLTAEPATGHLLAA